MNFLGIGPAELILVLVVALIVFGPSKLPEIGNSLGKSIREFKRATSDVSKEFSDSMNQVRQPIDQIKEPIDDIKNLSLTGTATADRTAANNRTCSKCSTINPMTNRFCGQCGADLAAAEET